MSRITEPVRLSNTGNIISYKVSKSQKSKAINKLGMLEDLEGQERLLILPCAIGDSVYVLTECEHIPERLDGTLWDDVGCLGTATGYYCPYENDCPFDGEDFEGCEKYAEETAVFKDTVKQISVSEDGGVYIVTEYCAMLGILGNDVFLTKEEAEKALEEMKNEDD